MRGPYVERLQGVPGVTPGRLQFLVYAAMGAVGTAGHYLTLFSAVHFGGIDPVAGSTAGFLVGAVINYALNHRITFRSRRRHREAFWRFLAVAGLGLCVNGAVMWLGVSALGVHYLLVQLVATGCVLLLTFSINRVWTFV